MSEQQPKIIYATTTKGPALAICPECKGVVGDTTVILSFPFYADVTSGKFEMLDIAFTPHTYCTCEKVKP